MPTPRESGEARVRRKGEAVRFGFFDQLPCADGFSEHQRYKDILAQIDFGDALGFDTVWLGEIHFIRPFLYWPTR